MTGRPLGQGPEGRVSETTWACGCVRMWWGGLPDVCVHLHVSVGRGVRVVCPFRLVLWVSASAGGQQ